MKSLSITAENFGIIRESLKNNESVTVNGVITLTSFVANTEKINPNGKKTRTPFFYVSDTGAKYTSTKLKNLLGIEAEVKGERKATTFASLWEQTKGLAKTASIKELKEAATFLTDLAKEREKEAKEAKEAEIKRLENLLKKLKGK